MEIKVGKYVLKTEPNNMWIEEEYERKKKNGKKTPAFRRVAGYVMNFTQLMRSFCDHKFRGSGAKELRDLLPLLSETYEDMLAFRTEAFKHDLIKLEEKIDEIDKPKKKRKKL